MGIIKAVNQAIGGAFADQWLEVYEADNMGDQTVFSRGVKIRRGKTVKEPKIPLPMVLSFMYTTISSCCWWMVVKS